MTKRPMLPRELNNVRSAYRRDIITQRQQELRSNAENVKTSLKQVDSNQLTDWDLETLRMVDDIFCTPNNILFLHGIINSSMPKR